MCLKPEILTFGGGSRMTQMWSTTVKQGLTVKSALHAPHGQHTPPDTTHTPRRPTLPPSGYETSHHHGSVVLSLTTHPLTYYCTHTIHTGGTSWKEIWHESLFLSFTQQGRTHRTGSFFQTKIYIFLNLYNRLGSRNVHRGVHTPTVNTELSNYFIFV